MAVIHMLKIKLVIKGIMLLNLSIFRYSACMFTLEKIL